MLKNTRILHAYKRILVRNRGMHYAWSKIKIREAKDKVKIYAVL